MTTTPASRSPQFITDGGIETHIIFNMGVELPHFSAFPLNDSAAGCEVIRSYYRDYYPLLRLQVAASCLPPTAGAQVPTGPTDLAMIGRC